jgi:hypothetical protein
MIVKVSIKIISITIINIKVNIPRNPNQIIKNTNILADPHKVQDHPAHQDLLQKVREDEVK